MCVFCTNALFILYNFVSAVHYKNPSGLRYCKAINKNRFVVYIISFFANYLISQSLTRTSNYFVADIKNDLISKVLKLPMEFFDKQQTGYILERVKETDSLNVFFSPVFLKFLTSIFSCVGAWIFILSIRWELSLILIIFLPVLYYFTNYSSIQIKKVSKARNRADHPKGPHLN